MVQTNYIKIHFVLVFAVPFQNTDSDWVLFASPLAYWSVGLDEELQRKSF